MFAYADTLLSDGTNGYKARIAVGVTNQGQFVLYDLVDLKPANVRIKKTLTLPDGSTKADTTTQSNKNLKQSIPQTAKKSQESKQSRVLDQNKAVFWIRNTWLRWTPGTRRRRRGLWSRRQKRRGMTARKLYHGTGAFGFTKFEFGFLREITVHKANCIT